MTDESVLCKGAVERIGLSKSFLRHKRGDAETLVNKEINNHTEAVELVLKTLTDKTFGVIASTDEIGAVGHRVVHSAEDYTGSVKIDDSVLRVCENNCDLAPLHNPANIMGINACAAVMSGVPMVAVFDTAFHSTMPKYAYMYALPYEAYSKYRIRRYGFHGTSHLFVSNEAAKFLKTDIKKLKIVTCHLGNGASVAAVSGGASVDTSMGFTPLEGLPMGTRSGTIDAALVEYLMKKTKMTVSEVMEYLNKKSGMLGVSGIGSDFRDLTAALREGNEKSRLAIDMFSYGVKKYIGAYAAAMGGLDCVVFTAGVGENIAIVRELSTDGLEFLGIALDKQKNKNPGGGIAEISAKTSRVRVLIVPTNEELVIARETLRLV
jgi:acetate kinase